MTHILRTSTEHKTASLADEGNSAYCQSSVTHNIKHFDVGTDRAKVSGLNHQQLLYLIDNVYVPNKTCNFQKVYKNNKYIEREKGRSFRQLAGIIFLAMLFSSI